MLLSQYILLSCPIAAKQSSSPVSSLPFRYIPQIDFELDYELSIRNVYTDDDNIDKIDLVSPNLQITNRLSIC